MDRAFAVHFQGLAERRVAALWLAIRLYDVDHAGRFPATLDELVPEYIPAVPADPFASDGRQLGYIASPSPLIYSVAMNGKDDHGDTTLLRRNVSTTYIAGFADDRFAWRDAPMRSSPSASRTSRRLNLLMETDQHQREQHIRQRNNKQEEHCQQGLDHEEKNPEQPFSFCCACVIVPARIIGVRSDATSCNPSGNQPNPVITPTTGMFDELVLSSPPRIVPTAASSSVIGVHASGAPA